MPIADMLVDAASSYEILSFMDGYFSYNQIYIAKGNVSKTGFWCPSATGTYEWVMMPFGLKNARATYQRAMSTICHDLISKIMEVYIDDIVVKSTAIDTHPLNLKQSFDRIRKYGLKMNPLKCAFGISVGNFLGFLVHKKRN